ncbi:T9SS type A sorting domain-containing protein [bacterium]|nr:T9SS type A sorting domain-containing protein [bacterium]
MRQFFIFILLNIYSACYAQPTDTIWTVILGGEGIDFASSIERLTSDNYAVAGSFYSPSNPSGSFLAVLTEDGDTLFTRILGDLGVTDVFQVRAIDSEAFVFSGSYFQLGLGNKIVVGKMSLSGELEWLHHYDDLNAWIGFDIVCDEDSQHLTIVGGKPFGGSTPDAVIFKTDIDGDTLWSRAFGGANCEHFESVIQSCDGGYVAVGIDCPNNPGAFRVIVTKVTTDGDSLWTNYLGPDPRSWAHGICLTPDCGFLIVGEYETDDQDSQVLAIKTDSLGNELWTKTYGGSESDKCYGVRALSSGGYLLCGSTTSYGHGNIDTYLININEESDTIWTATYGTEYSEYARSLAIAANGEIILAGGTRQASGGNATDLFVTKMVDSQAIDLDTVSIVPAEFDLLSAYPNPFNPTTTISFNLNKQSSVKLNVFDVTGRQVSTLIDDNLTAGKHQVMFDGAGLPSGIYFARLQAVSRTMTRKMVLLK